MKKPIPFNDINYALIDIKEIKCYIRNSKGTFVNSSNDRDFPQILQATLMARIDIIKLLIKKGARTDLVTKYGDDMLSIAIESGDVETIKFVLDLGFKVSDSVIEFVDVNEMRYLFRDPVDKKNYLDYAKEILSSKDIIKLLEGQIISENFPIKKDTLSIRFKKLFQQKSSR